MTGKWILMICYLCSKRTTLIFAVSEVDPQSSEREQRQREGQTSALLQGPTNASLYAHFPIAMMRTSEERKTKEPPGQSYKIITVRSSDIMYLQWEMTAGVQMEEIQQ